MTLEAEGGRIGEFDWAATSLGPIAGWGPALRHALATLLRSPAPMGLFHGRDGVFLYNDAYRDIAGLRQPGGQQQRAQNSQ